MTLDSLGLGWSRGHRSHLLLVIASAIVPLALFAVVAWQDRVAVLDDAQAYVEHGADSVREHALGVFQSDALVVALIDQRIQSMTWDDIATSRPLHDYLANLVTQNPELEGAWIADASGNARNSSVSFPAPPSNASASDFFAGARKSDQLVFGARVLDSASDASGASHFYIAQRRGSADGGFDGAIVLNVSSSYFADVWRHSWHQSPRALTGLSNFDLEVLARTPDVTTSGIPALGRFGEAVRANPNAGSFRTVSVIDGIDRLIAYRRFGPYGAYVFYGIDYDGVLRTWHRHLLVYGAVFGLAALGLAALSILAARRAQEARLAIAALAAAVEQRLGVEKQLLQAEKLDALGKMAGGFAHDFGNVLMAAQLNLDLLRRHTTSEGEAALDNAIAAIDQGSETVRSLLLFARSGSLETQVIDTNALIENLAGLLKHSIGGISALEISLESGLWPVEVNANQFELALLNLALNARDAMPDGGKFRVAARNVSLSGSPEGLAGNFVEIAVSDTGCGMTAETAAKAMEPFFTTKEAGKGTGLGLGQVYGFAKNSGGTVTLKSAVGQGTTVTLYIPERAASASIAAA